ncbi:His Kinase A (phospho-acceptor) domain-containing protein [Paucidesulfovibrio gracilis DSM 16080]|uniref:histidine kinase n=1 Tax=Paucidesulfovibrio gracilis DSM 16080 TaxID=1121449 RepID=A0A1T4Y8B7_9BACT|nr:ATP-binding protein [Paucidesulfovibrio gracilis]SKA98067.1 His Kinase A (phospho-acceptor) domain-containing protein [Paucidesulfovibrio gracilis DSM 16080]
MSDDLAATPGPDPAASLDAAADTARSTHEQPPQSGPEPSERPRSKPRGPRPSLRTQLLALLCALVLVAALWSGFTLWSNFRTQALVVRMVDQDVASLRVAQALETDLVMQKGYATYFFLNADEAWLEQLEIHRKAFEERLVKARSMVQSDQGRELLARIETEYLRYVLTKNRVIDLYREGRREDGARLHWEVRRQFESLRDLCVAFRELHEEMIRQAGAEYRERAGLVSAMSWTAMPLALILGLLLGWQLLRRVLDPIRRLAAEGGGFCEIPPGRVVDEVKALSSRMELLVEDMDQTHSKLMQSREHLMQAEKMAMVGKLAAGVAHSIRNPLTSVKMRLFSLERSLQMNDTQREDFEVISEEIAHLDTIIRNFLEFSRRPKLRFQRVSLSDIVDTTVQLLRHRLDSCGVELRLIRGRRLPEVKADPDQIKEVVANLLLNACEAMVQGGTITIREETGTMKPQGKVATVRIDDNGPGIAEHVREQIFEPFFSTKEEGTGLGLSLARRIMEEHGGWLNLRNSGSGAGFVLVLPCDSEEVWHRY